MMGYEMVAIGASLGGVQALQLVLGALPEDFSAAVVVVLHRGHSSDDTLAEVLARAARLPLRDAEDKDAILPGQIYLAPADYHLLVDEEALALTMDPPVRFARPSIDVLFGTAAEAYKNRLIGVILTGNGEDGVEGLKRIAALGGLTVIQDPATAQAPALPEAAVAARTGAAILPLAGIGAFVVETVAGGVAHERA